MQSPFDLSIFMSSAMTNGFLEVMGVVRCNRHYIAARSEFLEQSKNSNKGLARSIRIWAELEQMTKDIDSLGKIVGFVDRGKINRAFKDTKVLARDAVVWHLVGCFRTWRDNRLILERSFLEIGKNNNLQSQMIQSLYKVQSEILLSMMSSYWVWEVFARNVCGNCEDSKNFAILQRALRHSLCAWARVRQDGLYSGILMSDDGQRKFADLEDIILQEIAILGCSIGGKTLAANFSELEQIIREEARSNVLTLNMEDLLITLLASAHRRCQMKTLQDFILSDNVWKRTYTWVQKRLRQEVGFTDTD
ncbi:unnamed protein product [Symbiodinium sp. CCMP2592]|nr:unnamed protein product [Symbiodinium sp. CCMP2592]